MLLQVLSQKRKPSFWNTITKPSLGCKWITLYVNESLVLMQRRNKGLRGRREEQKKRGRSLDGDGAHSTQRPTWEGCGAVSQAQAGGQRGPWAPWRRVYLQSSVLNNPPWSQAGLWRTRVGGASLASLPPWELQVVCMGNHKYICIYTFMNSYQVRV